MVFGSAFIMQCSFHGKCEIDCCEEIQQLVNFSTEHICIILSEVGLKPCVSLAKYNDYRICSSHFNFYLKLNEKRSRRKLCQIPSLLSSHPQIDNTREDGLRSLASRTHMKCASRGLKEKDILHFIDQAGVTLPVNTPCCPFCLKKIRERNEGECYLPSNMECSTKDDKLHLLPEDVNRFNFDAQGPPSDLQLHSENKDTVVEDPLTQFSCESVENSMEYLSQNSSQSFTVSHNIQHLNEFLKTIGESGFSDEKRYQWDSYTKTTKYYYTNRFRSIMKKLIALIFPENIEDVVKAIHVSEEHPNVTVSSSIIPEGTFGPLIHAYQTSETWCHRRQILSFFTHNLSFKEVKAILPNVTESKYYAAKNHAKNVGPGLPVNVTSTRNRMDPVKLDSFLDFITSPHVIRDLPYGERKIKLSDGTIHELPNVIRCMGSSDVIQQYKAYCSENSISPLGESTMYRILSECGAQVRTSLEGIDYFIAEGGRAFRTITDTLEELLKFQVISQQELKDFSALFLQCKQYLRTDFKVHISPDSNVADHCQTYALSDPLHPEFAATCKHSHNLVCVTCEQMKDAISSLMKTVQCSSKHGLADSLSDSNFRLQNAAQSISNLKCHLIRCRNQDAAKSDLFNAMGSNEVLLICDWSMKYLPRKYREDQSDWFGKRGLNWHITMAFHKTDRNVESLGFVHIFQSQISQDSITTAAIIINVMDSIQSIDSAVTSFHVWSDNAGCYKSTEMMALLNSYGKVSSYNFCEAQNGKGPCDRTGATLKSAIRRFVNQGHDVLTAHSMKEAIEKTAKNVRYRVCVSDIASQKTSFKPIPAISSYSNFSFEEGGIRVWKAYGIGSGLLIPNAAIPSIEYLPLAIVEEPEDIGFHGTSVTKNPKSEQIFQCTNEGCIEAFGSSEELSNHLLTEKCRLEFELSSSSTGDVTKRKYINKISNSDCLNLKLSLTEDTETRITESDLTLGWALKEARRTKRFNENQRDFLVEKFNVGLRTGKKEDPFLLSESMLYERKGDGTRRFSYDEILSVQQITSFFSRMSRKNKMAEIDEWEARKETEISKMRTKIINE